MQFSDPMACAGEIHRDWDLYQKHAFITLWAQAIEPDGDDVGKGRLSRCFPVVSCLDRDAYVERFLEARFFTLVGTGSQGPVYEISDWYNHVLLAAIQSWELPLMASSDSNIYESPDWYGSQAVAVRFWLRTLYRLAIHPLQEELERLQKLNACIAAFGPRLNGMYEQAREELQAACRDQRLDALIQELNSDPALRAALQTRLAQDASNKSGT